jgi:hypothetical protein
LYALLCTKVVDAPGVFCSNSSAFFTYLIRVAGWGEPEAARAAPEAQRLGSDEGSEEPWVAGDVAAAHGVTFLL